MKEWDCSATRWCFWILESFWNSILRGCRRIIHKSKISYNSSGGESAFVFSLLFIISYLLSSIVVNLSCKNSQYYTMQDNNFQYCWFLSVYNYTFFHCGWSIFIIYRSARVRMEIITRSEREKNVYSYTLQTLKNENIRVEEYSFLQLLKFYEY